MKKLIPPGRVAVIIAAIAILALAVLFPIVVAPNDGVASCGENSQCHDSAPIPIADGNDPDPTPTPTPEPTPDGNCQGGPIGGGYCLPDATPANAAENGWVTIHLAGRIKEDLL